MKSTFHNTIIWRRWTCLSPLSALPVNIPNHLEPTKWSMTPPQHCEKLPHHTFEWDRWHSNVHMYMWCVLFVAPFFLPIDVKETSSEFLGFKPFASFWRRFLLLWRGLRAYFLAEVMMPQPPPCSSMALTPPSLCFRLRRWKCTSCRPPPVRLLMWVAQVRPSLFELLMWLSARLLVLLALVLLHHSNHHIWLVYSSSVLTPAHLCDTTGSQLYTHGHWIV